MAAAFVAICGISMIAGVEAATVVILVGAVKAVDGIVDIWYAYCQREGLMRVIGVSMMANGFLTVVLMAVLIVWTGNLVWAVTGSIMASMLSGLGCCALTARGRRSAAYAQSRRSSPATSPGSSHQVSLRNLVLLAMPVGLASSLTSLASNTPRYAVEGSLGTEELGIFAALSYVVIATNTFIGAVTQVALPAMTRMWTARQLSVLSALTWRLVAASFAVGAVLVLLVVQFGRDLLMFIYGPGYAAHTDVLVVLTLAIAVRASVCFLDSALLAMRRFGSELLAALVMVAAAGLAALLVPPFGLVGAAWAVTLPAVVQFLQKSVLVSRALHGTASEVTQRTAAEVEKSEWISMPVSGSAPSAGR